MATEPGHVEHVTFEVTSRDEEIKAIRSHLHLDGATHARTGQASALVGIELLQTVVAVEGLLDGSDA